MLIGLYRGYRELGIASININGIMAHVNIDDSEDDGCIFHREITRIQFSTIPKSQKYTSVIENYGVQVEELLCFYDGIRDWFDPDHLAHVLIEELGKVGNIKDPKFWHDLILGELQAAANEAIARAKLFEGIGLPA